MVVVYLLSQGIVINITAFFIERERKRDGRDTIRKMAWWQFVNGLETHA